MNILTTILGNNLAENEWENDPDNYFTPPETLNEYSIEEEINRIITSPLKLNYKTTTAGELAQRNIKKPSEIPEKFRKFSKIFDEKESS